MEVTNNAYVNVATTQSTTTSNNKSSNNVKGNEAITDDTKQNEAYIYEESAKEKTVNYKPDPEKVKKLIEEANNKNESLMRLVEKLLQKQGKTVEIAFSKEFMQDLLVDVDEETRLQAEKDISEDGYYGVKQTSERILDFAKALSGGDPSKIEGLKKAVQQGFEEAEKAWGGELPEISKKTYDAVMKGFDEWEADSKQ